MRKYKNIIVLLALMMSVFSITNVYAWEALDTNVDGVNDTIQFCDGYREPIGKYMITKVCPEDPPPSWLDICYTFGIMMGFESRLAKSSLALICIC